MALVGASTPQNLASNILNVQRIFTVYLHLMLDSPVRKLDFRYALHVRCDFKPFQSLYRGIVRVSNASRCEHHRITIVLNVLVYRTFYN